MKIHTLWFIAIILLASCGGARKENGGIAVKENTGESAALIGETSGAPSDKAAKAFLKEYRPEKSGNGKSEIIRLGNIAFRDIAVQENLIVSETKSYFIRFKTIDQKFMDSLVKKGVIIGSTLPDNTLLVHFKNKSIKASEIKGIESIMPYQPFMKIAKSDGDVDKPGKLTISLWDNSYTNQFNAFCQSNTIEILSKAGKAYIVKADRVQELLKQDMVLRVEYYHEPMSFSASGRQVSDIVTGPNWPLFNAQSSPATVAVYDFGIDEGCADLHGALKNVFDTAGDNSTREFTSHGTIVSSIIAGRGFNSGGRILGVNPEANLLVFAMGDDLKGIVVPPSMEHLYSLAFNQGAKIANIGWGTYDKMLYSKYLSVSRDLDNFIYNHPEFIVVAPVGNNGRSIASPATAKNVIAVGALDGNAAASYSGRGPTEDSRIKPDLCVQGSALAGAGLNNSFDEQTGTSMAAAVLSGIISKLSSTVKQVYQINPTHSIIKAILVANTTETLPQDNPKLGFGKLISIYPLDNSHMRVQRFTSINNLALQEEEGLQFYAALGDELTFALAWTEPAADLMVATKLTVDLNLEVTTPSGSVITLNDSVNNVEKIKISTTEAGLYRVRVLRANPGSSEQLNDIALAAGSRLGFATAEIVQQSSSSSSSVSAPEVVYASSDGGTSQAYSSYEGGGYSSEETGSGSAASTGTQTSTGGSGTAGTTTPAAIPDLSALNDLNSTALDSPAFLEKHKLFVKPGLNNINTRVFGSMQGTFMGINFLLGGIEQSEKQISIADFSIQEYENYALTIPDNATGIIDADLLMRDQLSGVKERVPLKLIVDSTPPYLGVRYPEAGNDLIVSNAWIELLDTESGIATNFRLSINGTFLLTNQYQYNYGTHRLELFMDKIYDRNNNRIVPLQFNYLSDIAGNTMEPVIWSFDYKPGLDVTPPERPQNLRYTLENKVASLVWDINTEKDLKEYAVYRVSSDMLTWTRINQEPVVENHFSFIDKIFESVGVKAIDKSGNESDMAIVSIDQTYPDNHPELVINDIPEKSNKDIVPVIWIKDEGLIKETNITLNGVAKTATWTNGIGAFTVDDQRVNTLVVSVKDDDGNSTTKTVVFTIDKNKPDKPEVFLPVIDDKTVKVSWRPVVKAGHAITYTVRNGELVLAEKLTETQVYYTSPEYKQLNDFSVCAVDELGNESEEATVLINFEKGLSISPFNAVLSKIIPFEASVKVGLFRYTHTTLTLSHQDIDNNTIIDRTWSFEPSEIIKEDLNIEGIPDGSYRLDMSVSLKNEYPLPSISAINQTISIDNTPITIGAKLNGNTVNSGIIHAKMNDTLQFTVQDNHVKSLILVREGLSDKEYYDSVTVTITKTEDYKVIATDMAGNTVVKFYRVIADSTPPFVRVDSVGRTVQGVIQDENLLKYDVLINDVLYYSSDFNADGFICVTPPLHNETLSIKAYDKSGNVNADYSSQLTVETVVNSIANLTINDTVSEYYKTPYLKARVEGALSDGFVRYLLKKDNTDVIVDSDWVQTLEYWLTGLADGTYTISAQLEGAPTPLTRTFTVDTESPTLALKSYIFSNEPLSGAFTANDNLGVADLVVKLDGSIIQDIAAPIAAGNHRLEVDVADAAGNHTLKDTYLYVAEQQSSVEEWVVDLRLSTLTRSMNGQSFQTFPLSLYADKTHYMNRALKITILGSVNGGSVKINNEIRTDNTISEADLDGNYAIHCEAESGSLATAFLVVKDTLKPAITITQAPLNRYKNFMTWDSADIWTVSDDNLKIKTIKINNQLAAQWAWPLADGDYNLYIEAEDKAGNIETKTQQVIVDHTPPALVQWTLEDGGYYKKENITGPVFNDAGTCKIFYSLDGSTWSLNKPEDNGGPFTLAAKAVDDLGNTSDIITKSNIHIDNRTPLVEISGVPEGTDTTYVKTASPAWAVGPEGIQGNFEVSLTSGGLNVLSKYLENRVLGEGTYSLIALFKAANGTESVATRNFVVDKTPPSVSMSGYVENMTVNNDDIQIQFDDANYDSSTIKVFYENGVLFKSVGNNSGSFNLQSLELINANKYKIEVQAFDKAGNSSAIQTFILTYDTNAKATGYPIADDKKMILSGIVEDAEHGTWINQPVTVTVKVVEWYNIAHVKMNEVDMSQPLSTQKETIGGYKYDVYQFSIDPEDLENRVNNLAVSIIEPSAGTPLSKEITILTDLENPEITWDNEGVINFKMTKDICFDIDDERLSSITYAIQKDGIPQTIAINDNLIPEAEKGVTVRRYLNAILGVGEFANLADGVYTIAITAVDEADHSTIVNYRITVDTIDPIAELLSGHTLNNNFYVNNTTDKLFHFSDANLFKIKVKIDRVGQNPVNIELPPVNTIDLSLSELGWYHFTDVPITNDKFTITLTAEDIAENAVDLKPIVVTVDTIKPLIDSDKAGIDTHNGGLIKVSVADSNLLNFNVEISPNTTVSGQTAITVHDISNKIIDVDDLLPGAYTITANATDEAGNSANEYTRTFIVDKTPPVVAIQRNNETVSGSILSKDNVTLTLKSTDERALESMSINKVSVPAGELNNPINYNNISALESALEKNHIITLDTELTHTITVNAKDKAGNEAEQSIVVVIDKKAPQVTHDPTFFNGGGQIGGTAYYSGNFTDAIGFTDNYLLDENTLSITVNSVPLTSLTVNELDLKSAKLTVPITFEEAGSPYNVKYLAKDKAGNRIELDETIIVDTTEPSIVVKNDTTEMECQTSSDNETFYFSSFQLMVQAGDQNLHELRMVIDKMIDGTPQNIPTEPVVANQGGNIAIYQYTFTEAGKYKIQCTAVDKAGHTTTEKFFVVVDKVNPEFFVRKPLVERPVVNYDLFHFDFSDDQLFDTYNWLVKKDNAPQVSGYWDGNDMNYTYFTSSSASSASSVSTSSSTSTYKPSTFSSRSAKPLYLVFGATASQNSSAQSSSSEGAAFAADGMFDVDGTYTIDINAQDRAGNEIVLPTKTVEVDMTLPVLQLTLLDKNGSSLSSSSSSSVLDSYTLDATPTVNEYKLRFHVTDPHLVSYQVSYTEPYTETPKLFTSQGEDIDVPIEFYKFYFNKVKLNYSAIDQAGNEDKKDIFVQFTDKSDVINTNVAANITGYKQFLDGEPKIYKSSTNTIVGNLTLGNWSGIENYNISITEQKSVPYLYHNFYNYYFTQTYNGSTINNIHNVYPYETESPWSTVSGGPNLIFNTNISYQVPNKNIIQIFPFMFNNSFKINTLYQFELSVKNTANTIPQVFKQNFTFDGIPPFYSYEIRESIDSYGSYGGSSSITNLSLNLFGINDPDSGMETLPLQNCYWIEWTNVTASGTYNTYGSSGYWNNTVAVYYSDTNYFNNPIPPTSTITFGGIGSDYVKRFMVGAPASCSYARGTAKVHLRLKDKMGNTVDQVIYTREITNR